MDLMCYATLAQLRKRDGADSTVTTDDPKRIAKLRAASKAITEECGERIFEPVQETRTYDWESNEYLWFRAHDLLTLTSLIDGTGNTKATAALIMQGDRFSDATLYGPWYAVRIDTTKDFLLYNVTPFRCIKVTGTFGYHDDYGVAGANAFLPVYTDATLVTALAPSGSVTSSQRVITLNGDPTTCYDGAFNTPGLSAGAMIQWDSEWSQVLSTSTPSTIVLQRGANGTTAATHNTSSAISVYQPVADIQEATLRYAQFLMRQDDAPFGKVLTPSLGQMIIPYKVPPDVIELITPYIKRRVV